MKQLLTALLIAGTLVASGQNFSVGKTIQKSILVVQSNGEEVMRIDTLGNVFIKDTLQALKQIFRYAKGETDSIYQWLNKLSKAEEVLKYIDKKGFLIDRNKYLEALKNYYNN